MNFIVASLLVAPHPQGPFTSLSKLRRHFRHDRGLVPRTLPDLPLAGGELAHPPLRLGGVGEGEACEESHDRLLSDTGWTTPAKVTCRCHQH
jgi:hypothetical protein